jgi:hypothetical protein
MVNLKTQSGTATGTWDWEGLPRNFVSERQKCAPGHKSSKQCLMIVCCENATRNHKLNLVLRGKAKPFTDTKTNCIPVNYYNPKGAWMDKEIFENWFHKHCFRTLALLKEIKDYHSQQCCYYKMPILIQDRAYSLPKMVSSS